MQKLPGCASYSESAFFGRECPFTGEGALDPLGLATIGDRPVDRSPSAHPLVWSKPWLRLVRDFQRTLERKGMDRGWLE
jgi:hypothetical protein